MAANLLRMDAVALVAAAQNNDRQLSESVMGRHQDAAGGTDPALVAAVADVAVILAGAGASRTAITGYLDFISANGNGNGKRT